jgi:hypothetical protein
MATSNLSNTPSSAPISADRIIHGAILAGLSALTGFTIHQGIGLMRHMHPVAQGAAAFCLFIAILYSEHRLISAFNNPSSDISTVRTLPTLLALLTVAIYCSTLTSYQMIATTDAQDSVRDRIANDWRAEVKSVADLRASARDAVSAATQATQKALTDEAAALAQADSPQHPVSRAPYRQHQREAGEWSRRALKLVDEITLSPLAPADLKDLAGAMQPAAAATESLRAELPARMRAQVPPFPMPQIVQPPSDVQSQLWTATHERRASAFGAWGIAILLDLLPVLFANSFVRRRPAPHRIMQTRAWCREVRSAWRAPAPGQNVQLPLRIEGDVSANAVLDIASAGTPPTLLTLRALDGSLRQLEAEISQRCGHPVELRDFRTAAGDAIDLSRPMLTQLGPAREVVVQSAYTD